MNATPLTRAAVADPRASDTTIIEPLPRPAVAGPAIVSREILFEMPQPAAADGEATGAPRDAAPDTVLRSAAERDAVERDLPQEVRADAVERDGRAVVPDAVVPDAHEHDAQEPFVLSLSTGEEARVTGGGLLGRRPVAQPGESVPQVVQISDPGRSVSKTHLEFGIEAGELWICDRYSGNGTIVYPPGARPRRCEPGRRYRVARGSRVEIGDQYFDVS